MRYVCVSPDKKIFDINGQYLGDRGLRALYYSKKLHRKRVYRSSFPIPIGEDLEIFAYKNKKTAEKLCEEMNLTLNEDFKVVEYVLPTKNIIEQLENQENLC